MSLSEYAFDLTRLWREPPHQTREARPLIGERSGFCDRAPQGGMVNPWFAGGMDSSSKNQAFDVKACRSRVREELAECESTSPRDALRRAWINGRCGHCRLCPQARAAPSRASMAP